MSSHLSGSHRRSADNNNSRERRTKDSGNTGNSNANNNNNSTDYSSSAAGHSRTRGQNTNDNQVKEAIIDLYLKVKIGSKNEVSLQTQIRDHNSQLISVSLSSRAKTHSIID